MHMFRSPNRSSIRAAFAMFGAALVGLQSCQTSEPETPSSELEVSASVSYQDAWKVPDSLTWAVGSGQHRKTARQEISPTIATGWFTLPTSRLDSIHVGVWASGIRTFLVSYTRSSSTSTTLTQGEVVTDSIAKALLESTTSASERIHDSVLARYARHLVDGTPAFAGYPGNCPVGIDTARLVRLAMLYAATKASTMENLAKSWSLGIGKAQAYELVQELVKAGKLGDSLANRAFPPYPVRIGTALSLPDMEAGSSAVVAGVFVGDSGLAKLGWKILQGSEDRSAEFKPGFSAQLEAGRSVWNLATDAGMTISVTTAPEGSYLLLVWMTDVNGRTDTARSTFQVLPAADRTGPAISILSPRQDSILENKDSVVQVVVAVDDRSGVDSVVIQGAPADSSEGRFSRSVTIPASGASFPIRIHARDKAGNTTDSVVRIARRSASGTLNATLSRLAPENQSGNTLAVDDSLFQVEFVCRSPYGIADTGVRIGGRLARRVSDTVWSLDVFVPANGFETTIPIDLVDRNGGKVTDWVKATRAKDATGPAVVWSSPSKDTIVENGTSTVAIRFQVQDLSGVDSVRIRGRAPEPLGNGAYLALVDLPPSGTATPIVATAWDRLGNSSTATLLVTRRAPGQVGAIRIRLESPSQAKGNQLIAEVDSFLVKWVVASELGLFDSSVRIAGAPARREKDSVWSARIHVPATGQEMAIVLAVADAGGRLASDTVWVARAKVLPRPVLRPMFDSTQGAPPLRAGLYATMSDSVEVAWSSAGECAGCEFRIDGKRVDPVSGIVRSRIQVPPGTSGHVLLVTQDGIQVGEDSISIHRYKPLSIVRTAPASDTVDYLVGSVDISWTVRNAARVDIGGVAQPIAANGAYSTRLSSFLQGANVVRLTATDSMGRLDSSVVTLVKVMRVDLSLVPDLDTLVQWDSARFTISSLTGGAALSWSTDSANWMDVPADGRVALRQDGRVFARGARTGYLPNTVGSKSYKIRHPNTAPSYKRSNRDTIKVLEDAKPYRSIWSESVSMGGVRDSAQKASFLVTPIGTGANLFSAAPAIDAASGILTFTVLPDANGTARFRVILKDDGGIERWGVDTSRIDTLVVSIAPVNDAPIPDAYEAFEAPITGTPYSRHPPTANPGGGASEKSQYVNYRFDPLNETARTCFLVAPKVERDGMGFFNLGFTTSTGCIAGTALFRMTLKDDGGTLSGGVDSAATTLEIRLTNTVTDAKGAVYHYRKMGGLLWLQENIGSTCGATCPAEGTAFQETDTARVCPSGWRIPSAAEWKALVAWAGNGSDSLGSIRLRSDSGWTYTSTFTPPYDYNGDNSTGFNLVPTDHMDQKYSWYEIATMWTSTEDSPRANFTNSGFSVGASPSDFKGPRLAAPIRCVK